MTIHRGYEASNPSDTVDSKAVFGGEAEPHGLLVRDHAMSRACVEYSVYRQLFALGCEYDVADYREAAGGDLDPGFSRDGRSGHRSEGVGKLFVFFGPGVGCVEWSLSVLLLGLTQQFLAHAVGVFVGEDQGAGLRVAVVLTDQESLPGVSRS